MLHASFLRGSTEIAKTECNMKSFTGMGASGSGATVWYGDAGSRCTLDVPQGGATSVRAVVQNEGSGSLSLSRTAVLVKRR
jgi:hypothetical protein